MKQAILQRKKPIAEYSLTRGMQDNAFLETGNIVRRLREGAFILCAGISVYLFIALLTYHTLDPAWSHTASSIQITNAGGRAGAWIADVLLSVFGYVAYFFPVVIAYAGLLIFSDFRNRYLSTHTMSLWGIRLIGLILSMFTACGLVSMHYLNLKQLLPMGAGGLVGGMLKTVMVDNLNYPGATVALFVVFLIGLTLYTGMSWLHFVEALGRWGFVSIDYTKKIFFLAYKHAVQIGCFLKQTTPGFVRKVLCLLNKATGKQKKSSSPAFLVDKGFSLPKCLPVLTIKKPKKLIKLQKRDTKMEKVPLFSKGGTVMPSLDLLDARTISGKSNYPEQFLDNLSRLVEQKLAEFGVQVQVVAVHPGPVITQFELALAPGVKASKITGLSKDLARALSVMSVRVLEVVPGKSVVGLELPNIERELICLKDILAGSEYQQADSILTLGVGKDIAGKPVTIDLAKMPHLLVAGTTGAGKSVGLNAMLLSILYKASPEQVRLLLIDPKMLELAIYDRIPHLLAPVVTDMKDAANSLRWCVAQMEHRYQLMSMLGVRNMSNFNRKLALAAKAGHPVKNPLWKPGKNEESEHLDMLPYIVVVVDEFADMMMVVGKKVEELIARLAQKARAAGIHLILATQRPSVDVITGVIKANIPTRISYQVSTRIDSRTILDQQGAEQLLGHGDMLYLPPGVGLPKRIHGAFVSDEEVHKVVDELRKQRKEDYVESLVKYHDLEQNLDANLDEYDELYDQAMMIVTTSRRASISHIQRRLKIGYNRAARIIERMEADGVISMPQAHGTREILAPPPPPSS